MIIIIIGLVILIAAVVAGVAGVLSNSGSGHPLTHHFAVLGYHVTGSTGTLFLYGIVVGALALFGLSLLLAGARRTSRRGREARRGLTRSRRETATVTQDRDDLRRAALPAGRRPRPPPPRPRGPPRTHAIPPRDRHRHPGPRRPARPARHRPHLHRQHARRRRRQPPGRPRSRPARPPAGPTALVRAPDRRAARNAARPGRRCPRCRCPQIGRASCRERV